MVPARRARARVSVNFLHAYAYRPCGVYARVSQFTLPWGTLRSLVLSHAIENQNSDFVTV
jgi:hypothetical protein